LILALADSSRDFGDMQAASIGTDEATTAPRSLDVNHPGIGMSPVIRHGLEDKLDILKIMIRIILFDDFVNHTIPP
jgi:hypothetical protein